MLCCFFVDSKWSSSASWHDMDKPPPYEIQKCAPGDKDIPTSVLSLALTPSLKCSVYLCYLNSACSLGSYPNYRVFIWIFALKFSCFFYASGIYKNCRSYKNLADLLSSSFIALSLYILFLSLSFPSLWGVDVHPQQNRRWQLPCKKNMQHFMLPVEKQGEEIIAGIMKSC